MSRVNTVLEEVETRLKAITSPVDFSRRVVVCEDEDALLDAVKGIRSYPAIGIVYEGMRSMPEEGKPTEQKGISAEMIVSFVLVEQGGAIHNTEQKLIRSTDCLEAMRDQFMGQRSTATGHKWHFLVEAPAELKAGMVVWVQRWSVPVQLPPKYR